MAISSNPLSSAELFWNNAAETYDQKFSGTTVVKIRRRGVQQWLGQTFYSGQRVLELSCGTGIDAVFLASRGVRVTAYDISPRMIELARTHAAQEDVSPLPAFRVLATEHLSTLEGEATFDGAFSNFAGLNCVDDLHKVAEDLSRLMTPGARLIICMMGRFVPLEIIWFLAHGQIRRALFRLMGPRTDYSDSTGLIIKRPTVKQIQREMQPAFRLKRWKGIGIVVPPSSAEHFASRFCRHTGIPAVVDSHIRTLPLFRNMADCVLLEFQCTEAVVLK